MVELDAVYFIPFCMFIYTYEFNIDSYFGLLSVIKFMFIVVLITYLPMLLFRLNIN